VQVRAGYNCSYKLALSGDRPAPSAPPAPALPNSFLADTLTAALGQKRRRTHSSPSSTDHRDFTAAFPYLRSGLPYLNVRTSDTIGQVDGADDSELLSPAADQPTASFQNPDTAAGMAARTRRTSP
jgi:hypothetical protein